MTNYIFNGSDGGSYWEHETNTVFISVSGTITEKEQESSLLDSLVHEHLHKAIEKIEPQTTSCLFDAIGWKLRSKKDQEILERCLKRKGKMSWRQVMKKRGIEGVKRAYAFYFEEEQT